MIEVAQLRVWDELEPETRSVDVTREQVISALEWYDDLHPRNDYTPYGKKKPWAENNTYHWAVWHGGRFYPPKVILGQIVGERRKFWGGNLSGQANAVLKNLRFRVDPKPGVR